MVTTASPSPDTSPERLPEPPTMEQGQAAPVELQTQTQDEEEQPQGFLGLVVKSVFEPGANAAVVMAMNVSFFLLVITLFGLAILTSWNVHVLMFLGVSTLLWVAMVWFVMEISRVQSLPENMPIQDDITGPDTVDASVEAGKTETRKDR